MDFHPLSLWAPSLSLFKTRPPRIFSVRHPAAVDKQVVALNSNPFASGQEDHRLGNFLSLAKPPRRHVSLHLLPKLRPVSEPVDNVRGVGRTRADAVHYDSGTSRKIKPPVGAESEKCLHRADCKNKKCIFAPIAHCNALASCEPPRRNQGRFVVWQRVNGGGLLYYRCADIKPGRQIRPMSNIRVAKFLAGSPRCAANRRRSNGRVCHRRAQCSSQTL